MCVFIEYSEKEKAGVLQKIHMGLIHQILCIFTSSNVFLSLLFLQPFLLQRPVLLCLQAKIKKSFLKQTVDVIPRNPNQRVTCKIHNGTLQIFEKAEMKEIRQSCFFSKKLCSFCGDTKSHCVVTSKEIDRINRFSGQNTTKCSSLLLR